MPKTEIPGMGKRTRVYTGIYRYFTIPVYTLRNTRAPIAAFRPPGATNLLAVVYSVRPPGATLGEEDAREEGGELGELLGVRAVAHGVVGRVHGHDHCPT